MPRSQTPTVPQVVVRENFFEENPVELRGVFRFTAPFGKFRVLDEDMRIIRTGQKILAVNIRNKEDWF